MIIIMYEVSIMKYLSLTFNGYWIYHLSRKFIERSPPFSPFVTKRDDFWWIIDVWSFNGSDKTLPRYLDNFPYNPVYHCVSHSLTVSHHFPSSTVTPSSFDPESLFLRTASHSLPRTRGTSASDVRPGSLSKQHYLFWFLTTHQFALRSGPSTDRVLDISVGPVETFMSYVSF